LKEVSYIPLYINTSKNVTQVVPFLSSTHVLYDIIPNIRLHGVVNYNLGSCAVPVRCIYFPYLNVSALYLSNHTSIVGLTLPHLLRISRIQYGPDMFPFGTIHTNNVLEYCFYMSKRSLNYKVRPNYKGVRAVLAGKLELIKTKVSAKHLRHITVKELSSLDYDTIVKIIGPGMALLEQLVDIQVHDSFFIGMLVWFLLLPKEARA